MPFSSPSPPTRENPGALAQTQGPKLRVGFVLLNQFTLAAFSGLIEVLRLAADHGGRSRQLHAGWSVMTIDGAPRRSSCGVAVSPNQALIDPARFDYIAVCGGNDYLNDSLPEALLSYLQRAAGSGVRILGICTGTFAIARAGLVGSRRVCVHWNVLDAFKERFPRVSAGVERLFIDEGDLITCAGSTAAIDLGLYLVARHCGADKAQQAMRHMMLQDMRPGDMPQPHFFEAFSSNLDIRVQQSIHFIQQRLDDPPPVAAIARYVGVSARQLERLFASGLGQSPASFQRKIRLDYARWLILNSKRPLTEIAMSAGFADSAHLSRDFKAAFGDTPRAFRRSAGPFRERTGFLRIERAAGG
jgi:transcriptional regulator GlxA family with amidase domain